MFYQHLKNEKKIGQMKPLKLVREKTREVVSPEEITIITDINELNNLYLLKLQEEILEIKASDHKDINEFADLIQVAVDFAVANGFTLDQINQARLDKLNQKGWFSNVALNNLNPNNPSNEIYFVRAQMMKEMEVGQDPIQKEMEQNPKNKIGIICDLYKLSTFEAELKAAAFTFETFPTGKQDMILIKVNGTPDKQEQVAKICRKIEDFYANGGK